MKYTDEEIKFIEDKFPELKPKQLPTLDYSKLLVKPNLDQIIVSFLEKECEVFVQPSSVGKWNGWDTLSAIGIIFSGADNANNIARTILYSNRSKQVSDSAEDWRTWKMWALERKEFAQFKSKVINEVESYNLKVREKLNKEIEKIERYNTNIKQKLSESSTIKKIDEALKNHAEEQRIIQERYEEEQRQIKERYEEKQKKILNEWRAKQKLTEERNEKVKKILKKILKKFINFEKIKYKKEITIISSVLLVMPLYILIDENMKYARNFSIKNKDIQYCDLISSSDRET